MNKKFEDKFETDIKMTYWNTQEGKEIEHVIKVKKQADMVEDDIVQKLGAHQIIGELEMGLLNRIQNFDIF